MFLLRQDLDPPPLGNKGGTHGVSRSADAANLASSPEWRSDSLTLGMWTPYWLKNYNLRKDNFI